MLAVYYILTLFMVKYLFRVLFHRCCTLVLSFPISRQTTSAPRPPSPIS